MTLMTEKEFKYHISEFMNYLRKMEESLSANWDKTTEFQTVVRNNATSILNELSKNERLADFKAVVEGIKSQVQSAMIGIQRHNEELEKGRRELTQIRGEISRMKEDFIRDLKETLKSFESFDPDKIATKGALKAIQMVQEFKEAYEYVRTIKTLLTKKELPDFGYFPQGVNPQKWNMPIEELDLLYRTREVLQEANIKTVGELCLLREVDLLKWRNCGRKTIANIKERLKDLNLSLGMDDN